jgi:hypothetical protein
VGLSKAQSKRWSRHRIEVLSMDRRTMFSLAGVALATELTGYVLWRPRMLRWGATAAEASEPLPGDDRTPNPRVQSTRAITIDAPPGQVWPWLMQMGIGRAGFYTHDWVERLMFRARYIDGRHSATRIHPELASLTIGDAVPMGAGVSVPVSDIKPCEYLIAQETFVLRPLAGDRTRLITRYRGMGYGVPVTGRSRDRTGRRAGAKTHSPPRASRSRPRPGAARGGLPRGGSPAPLHGDRDAQRHQGTSRTGANPCQR